MYRFLVFLLGLPLLIACGQTPSEAQTPRPGFVVGRVVDEKGAPIAGAEIYINYNSSVVTWHGKSTNVTVYTKKDGTYAASLKGMPPGEYSATGSAFVTVRGQRERIELIPQNSAPFASNDAPVRNFRLGLAESTSDNPQYGVGGMILVDDAIGQALPMENIELVIIPANGGQPIRRKLKETGEGWVATGLPPQGRFEVFASLNGRRLPIRELDRFDDPYRGSYVGEFKRYGPGIFQMRVEVTGN